MLFNVISARAAAAESVLISARAESAAAAESLQSARRVILAAESAAAGINAPRFTAALQSARADESAAISKLNTARAAESAAAARYYLITAALLPARAFDTARAAFTYYNVLQSTARFTAVARFTAAPLNLPPVFNPALFCPRRFTARRYFCRRAAFVLNYSRRAAAESAAFNSIISAALESSLKDSARPRRAISLRGYYLKAESAAARAALIQPVRRFNIAFLPACNFSIFSFVKSDSRRAAIIDNISIIPAAARYSITIHDYFKKTARAADSARNIPISFKAYRAARAESRRALIQSARRYFCRRAISSRLLKDSARGFNRAFNIVDSAARAAAAADDAARREIVENCEKYITVKNSKLPAPRCDSLYITAARAARAALMCTYSRDSQEFILKIYRDITNYLLRNIWPKNQDAENILQSVQLALTESAYSAARAAHLKHYNLKSFVCYGYIDFSKTLPAHIEWKIKAESKTLVINDAGDKKTYSRGDTAVLTGLIAVKKIAILAAMKWIDKQRSKKYTGTVLIKEKNSAGEIVERRRRVELLPLEYESQKNNDESFTITEILKHESAAAESFNKSYFYTMDYFAEILGENSAEFRVIRNICYGYNGKEIAEKMEISAASVSRLLNSARKKLIAAGISPAARVKYRDSAAAGINEFYNSLRDFLRGRNYDITAAQNTDAARAAFESAAARFTAAPPALNHSGKKYNYNGKTFYTGDKFYLLKFRPQYSARVK